MEMNKNNDDGLLSGCLVLDFSQFLAGPSAALRLADLGADVIKIERPEVGDLCRQLRIADQTLGEDSALFHTINRNKRSFTADLKAAADLNCVKKLIARADVMIHSFRPGVMERIGLSYEDMQAVNPRLVYATISGYGPSGPWQRKPGQDLLAQARSGLVWLSGDADQGPVPIGISVADMMAGAHMAQGVLAALLRQAKTGRGARVDVSLMESALDLQFESLTAYLNGAGEPARAPTGNANAYIPAPYGIYHTSDGYLALAMAPLEKLADLLECPTLESYCGSDADIQHRDAIKSTLGAHLATQTTRFWLDRLEPSDIWCARVLTWSEMMDHEGFTALDATQDIHHPNGIFRTTRCPIRVDGKVLKADRLAPKLGADTGDIVREFDLDVTEKTA